jgi:Polyketide cyclase / dehydrase and lipid transport
MARYHATVQSRRPAQDTFAYLATFSNAARWDPGVLTARQLGPGPVTAGTRFRLVVPFLGRRMPLTYVVTGYGPGRRVTLTATSGLLRAGQLRPRRS